MKRYSTSLVIREKQIKTISYLLEWSPSKKEKEITNTSVDVEKKEHCALLMGLQIGTATVETSVENPKKLKTELPGDIAFHCWEWIHSKEKSTTSKRYVHASVHSSSAYSKLDGNNRSVH